MGLIDKITGLVKVGQTKNNLLPSGGLDGFQLNNDGYMPLQINSDGKKENDIAKYTTIYHLNRVHQDIAAWRNAVLEMEQIYIPHRVKVQLMYEDTVLNGHVQSAIRKRKNLILLKDFEFKYDDGTVDKETTKLFKQHWFNTIQSFILDGLYFGYNLVNWTAIKNGIPVDIKTIRKQFISPDRRNIAPFPYSLMGHSLDDEDIADWSLYIDTPNQHGLSPCGYGLLYEVANYEIILRNLLGYNADYTEKYGMPLTVINTNKVDEDERGYLEKMVKNLGSSGYLIKDPSDDVQFTSYDKVGEGFKSYADLELRCEKKISKLLLGHADALDSIPGMLGNQSSDTPISRGLIEIETADARFVEYWVNDHLLDKLRNCGMNIPEGVRFEFLNNKEKMDEEKNLMEKLNSVSTFLKTMTEAGYKPDQKWVEDILEIKVNIETPEIYAKESIKPNSPIVEPQAKINLRGGKKIDVKEALNPYPNFHAARIEEPSKFQPSTFRTKTITNGVTVIIGKLIGGNNMVAQAYRFDATIFSSSEAKKWLKEHKIEYISFHAATTKPSTNGVDIKTLINKQN